ncbi:putative deacetylase LmbE-like domain-containing protein [Aspergillus pseudocaelatus]|uniref:N-acetylglucosaminylphosphatidylinositol deacetylase n=1 Tax=Aspergillus pseudocaelatus TaxID=1825620 RepID=A0ABQ6WNE7_9EURO|nr:putative deacetylase LmbE-like domain-containing protein [Aspergillus pseudocaelatus]
MAYFLWDDDGVAQFVKSFEPELEEQFYSLPSNVERSDVFRILVAKWIGGIYGDMDTEPLRNPSSWITTDDLRSWEDSETNQLYGAAGPIRAIVGLEADCPPDSDAYWRMGYAEPVQLTQWSLAAAPRHPISQTFLDRLSTNLKNTTSIKTSQKHSPSNQAALNSIDPLLLTGPAAFTAAVKEWLVTTTGLRWNALSGLADGGQSKVVGDILVLPITGFSPGRGIYGNMGSKSVDDPSARLFHHAQGSWRKTDFVVEAGKFCRTKYQESGYCRQPTTSVVSITTMRVLWFLKRLSRMVRGQSLRRLAFPLTLLIIAVSLGLYLLLAYSLANDPRLVPIAFQEAKSILLVTAHPDDETLFFSPTITYRQNDAGVKRSLLVISSGNYDGLGDKRQSELHSSCDELGIPEDRCVVLDIAELQDNPKQWWNEDMVKDLVTSYKEKWHVDLIVTFDNGGISGHINHRSVSAGVRKYVQSTPDAPAAYMLQSTPLLRKYSSLLDLIPTSIPFTWRILKALLTTPLGRQVEHNTVHDVVPLAAYNSKALIVSSWRTYRVSRAAFSQHDSHRTTQEQDEASKQDTLIKIFEELNQPRIMTVPGRRAEVSEKWRIDYTIEHVHLRLIRRSCKNAEVCAIGLQSEYGPGAGKSIKVLGSLYECCDSTYDA